MFRVFKNYLTLYIIIFIFISKPIIKMRPMPWYTIKKLLFPAAFLFFSFTMSAQEMRTTFSKEFSIRNPYSLSEGTCKIGNFYYRMEVDESDASKYAFRIKKVKFGITLYQYDSDMNEWKKTELGGRNEKFGPFYPKIVWFNNKLLLFYFKVQQDEQIKFLLSEIDTTTLTATSTTEIYTIANAFINRASFRRQLRYVVSPDGSKLFLVLSDNTTELSTCTITGDKITEKKTLPLNNMKAFAVGNVFIDNKGNRYIGYRYNDSVVERGIIMENGQDETKWQLYNTGQKNTWANDIYFAASADKTKTYAYSNFYHDYLNEGVVLATADAAGFSITNVQLFPYPDSLKRQLSDAGYGQKVKGNYTVQKIIYMFTELENGTIVFTGSPSFSGVSTITRSGGTTAIGTSIPSSSYSIRESGAGTIINIFTKDDKSIFSNIERDQFETDAAGCIVFGYKNKLVCIYNESRLALQPHSYDGETIKDPSGLILAQVIIGSDGTVLSAKKIAEAPAKNYFFTAAYKTLPGNTWLIPVGRERMNLKEYYTQVSQWLTVEVK